MSLYELKCRVTSGGLGHDNVLRVMGLIDDAAGSSMVLEFSPALVEKLTKKMEMNSLNLNNGLTVHKTIKVSLVFNY